MQKHVFTGNASRKSEISHCGATTGHNQSHLNMTRKINICSCNIGSKVYVLISVRPLKCSKG